MPHPEHADHVAADVSASGGVEQHLDSALILGVEGKLEVGCLSALQSVVQHLLDADLVLLGDEVLYKIAAKHLGAREARDGRRLVVPLVHKPVRVDAEDGRVRRVDEGLQLLRHLSLLHLHLFPLRDVLAHTQHPHNTSGYVRPWSGVEQHLHALVVLSIQRKLEVGCALAKQGVVQHLTHRRSEVRTDVHLDKVLAQHLGAREARDLCRLVVPLVHKPMSIDAEDGRVRCIYEGLQFHCKPGLLHLHLLALRDVLSYS